MVFPSWLRPCAALIVMAGLLGLGLGCKGRSSGPNGTVSLSGYVNFTRLPVTYDANGSPTGLSQTGVAYPARGVMVRAFQLAFDVAQNGKHYQNWRLVSTTYTDGNGYYAFSNVYGGYATFVEVDSVFQQDVGHQSAVQLIADSAGIGSLKTEPNRPIWAYRVDVANTPVPNPVAGDITSTNVAVAVITGDTTLNINLGATAEVWAATLLDWSVPGITNDPSNPQAKPIETQALGSRPLAILDNAYIFSYWYGDPTPSQVKGGVLDLHYYPGASGSPSRSYVIYDTTRTPLSFDGTKSHYFGVLAGGPSVDDAWDPGVIYPMLARNYLYGQATTGLYPTGLSSIANLSPDLAVVDGLGDAMAAILLQTPFLTDTSVGTPLFPRDIRNLPANPGIASPATLSALAWQLNLVANSVAAAGSSYQGTYAEWQQHLTNPWVMARFFTLIYPNATIYNGYNGTYVIRTDICSIYAQVARLLEAKQASEPVDLGRIFNDGNLFTQLNPYGITWPFAPQFWTFLAVNWGSNPDSLQVPLPAFPTPLTMADAVTIPTAQMPTQQNQNPPVLNLYPNSSQGEVAYAKFSLTFDRNFNLSVTTDVAPLASTLIEVVMDGDIQDPYLFGAGQKASYNLTLTGNSKDVTNPTWHFVRVRLLSPNVQEPSNIQPTVHLEWTHNP
jgi:hypothetical protein